jgi:Fe-S cluster biogenesis protein NfuA
LPELLGCSIALEKVVVFVNATGNPAAAAATTTVPPTRALAVTPSIAVADNLIGSCRGCGSAIATVTTTLREAAASFKVFFKCLVIVRLHT